MASLWSLLSVCLLIFNFCPHPHFSLPTNASLCCHSMSCYQTPLSSYFSWEPRLSPYSLYILSPILPSYFLYLPPEPVVSFWTPCGTSHSKHSWVIIVKRFKQKYRIERIKDIAEKMQCSSNPISSKCKDVSPLLLFHKIKKFKDSLRHGCMLFVCVCMLIGVQGCVCVCTCKIGARLESKNEVYNPQTASHYSFRQIPLLLSKPSSG